MINKFEVLFLDEVEHFLDEIDEKAKLKIMVNISNAQLKNDPRLMKKA